LPWIVLHREGVEALDYKLHLECLTTQVGFLVALTDSLSSGTLALPEDERHAAFGQYLGRAEDGHRAAGHGKGLGLGEYQGQFCAAKDEDLRSLAAHEVLHRSQEVLFLSILSFRE